MVGEIFGGISAFKAMFDMAKSVNDMADTAKRDRLTVELQKQILAAQAAQVGLVEEVNRLKAELVKFETWKTEKQRYKLDVIAPGIFCYIVKEEMRDGEPTHRICANCYSAGKKSFLQQHIKGPYYDKFDCHTCGESLGIDKGRPPQQSSRSSQYEV